MVSCIAFNLFIILYVYKKTHAGAECIIFSYTYIFVRYIYIHIYYILLHIYICPLLRHHTTGHIIYYIYISRHTFAFPRHHIKKKTFPTHDTLYHIQAHYYFIKHHILVHLLFIQAPCLGTVYNHKHTHIQVLGNLPVCTSDPLAIKNV